MRRSFFGFLLAPILLLDGCRESPKPGPESATDTALHDESAADASDSTTTSGSVVGIDIVPVTIDSARSDATPSFTIDISYPLATARSGEERLHPINRAVRREVESIMSTFLEQIDAFQPDEEFGISSSLSIRYDVAMINPRCLSVEMIVDEYYAGAAHPNARTITMTYDVERATLLRFTSLFDDDSAMLAKVSALTSRHLMSIPDMDSAWIAEGTKPIEENFNGFLLTPDNLIILFDPYQVAPYAMGPQRVGIPWETIGRDAYGQVRHLLEGG